MVITHTATAFWHHFHPWITKTMELETISNFAIPNHRKSQNCAQSRFHETPKIHSKINKNGHLGLSVSIGCPPGPQDHQNGVPDTQKGTSRSKKWQLSVEKATHFSNQPVNPLICNEQLASLVSLNSTLVSVNDLQAYAVCNEFRKTNTKPEKGTMKESESIKTQVGSWLSKWNPSPLCNSHTKVEDQLPGGRDCR